MGGYKEMTRGSSRNDDRRRVRSTRCGRLEDALRRQWYCVLRRTTVGRAVSGIIGARGSRVDPTRAAPATSGPGLRFRPFGIDLEPGLSEQGSVTEWARPAAARPPETLRLRGDGCGFRGGGVVQRSSRCRAAVTSKAGCSTPNTRAVPYDPEAARGLTRPGDFFEFSRTLFRPRAVRGMDGPIRPQQTPRCRSTVATAMAEAPAIDGPLVHNGARVPGLASSPGFRGLQPGMVRVAVFEVAALLRR